MHGQVWIATRDIDEPNLKVKENCPLPDRFQSDYCVKGQLMPYFDDAPFRKIDPQKGIETHETELKDQVARLTAANDALRERVDALEAQDRKGAKKPSS